jgi:aspartate/tyrosine/aromatic aminotransferase
MKNLFFEHIGSMPADLVLEIGRMWASDPNPSKINLGIGIYLNEEGKCPVMSAVKMAEEKLLKTEETKSYLPIEGDAQFLKEAKNLLFKENSSYVVAMQTLGGTGALRILADYLKLEMPKPIYVSDPTWPNHHGVFKAAGLDVRTYPYYDRATHTPKKGEFIDFLDTIEKGSIVVLHGCCHNPTGVDLTHKEWDLVLEKFQKRGLFPFFDVAYLGLGEGIEKDRYAVDAFYKAGLEMCIAFSFSKMMDLYRERVGALMLVNHSHSIEAMQSTLKQIARRNYSNPSAHGALVAGMIMRESELRSVWLKDLEEHRLRALQMRKELFHALEPWIQHKNEFLHGRGFFSYLGISKELVLKLRNESIYLLDDSRINVLGINRKNIPILKDVFERIGHG